MKIFKGVSKITRRRVFLILGAILALLFSSFIGCTLFKTPSISLSPQRGGAMTSVMVIGSSFFPSTSVAISFEGSPVGDSETDTKGDFSKSITIPLGYTAGKKTIAASVGSKSVSADFELLPSITIYPQEGTADTQIVVSGDAFPSNTAVTVRFEGIERGSGTTDLHGSFRVNIIVPQGYTLGPKRITASYDSKLSEAVSFNLLSDAMPSPSPSALPSPSPSASLPPGPPPAQPPAGVPWSLIIAGAVGLLLGLLLSVWVDWSWLIIVGAVGSLLGFLSSAWVDWSWLIIAGVGALALLLCSIISFVAVNVVNSRRGFTDTRDYYRDYRDVEKALAQARNELEATRKRYETYENLQHQVPTLKRQYDQIVTEVRSHFPQLTETSFKDLLGEPATEYGALSEQIKALKAVRSYFTAEMQKGETLRTECLALANQIKEDEPALFDVLQEAINSATVGGLTALKPVLQKIQQQLFESEASANTKDELAKLEKSLESIRDYRYRLIPSRLVEFANELIKLPASARENAVREKVVQKIIGFVNDYLKL